MKYFVPTELEIKKRTVFKNGASIRTEYKSEDEYWVKYLPGNRADYFVPNFIFKTKKSLKIIPIPNFYTFLLIPIALVGLIFFEKVKMENIWTVIIALILFIVLMQSILIYPSLQVIKKKVNERE
ncbi:hypothetical protein [Gilvibacter sp.]|uniref:hypothetical protein n=1 Tax=Gilvibacter sp. TaxID=2729997 RepID=UPI003F49D307